MASKTSNSHYPMVEEDIKKGLPRKEVVDKIMKDYQVGKNRANEIYRNGVCRIEMTKGDLQINSRYVFNKDDDKYVIDLKSRKDPLVISGPRFRAICRDYSSWNGDLTSHEVCVKYSLTPEIFSELRRVFNLTKEREPLSAEEVWENTEDESVEAILEQKRYAVYEKFEKADWQNTKKDADKWREFQAKQLDPFSRILETWMPPKYVKVDAPKNRVLNFPPSAVIINVADIHVGAKADQRFLYRQRNWRHEDLEASMAEYYKKIRREMYSRNNGPREAWLSIGGDVAHTLSGFTDGGTKLDSEFLGEDQIDFAVVLLTAFINETLTTFDKVHVKAVSGNHSYLGDYVISKMLAAYFRTEKRIDFEITSARYLPFKIFDTLVILDHGASGKGIKSKLPRSAATRDSYIKSILLDKPEMLIGTNARVFLTNDQHHYEYIERSDFDLIIAPSIVAGDLYSDFSNWKSRPSQCIFVVDENGVKESIRFYFD